MIKEIITKLPIPTGTAVTETNDDKVFKFSRIYDWNYYFFYGLIILNEELEVINDTFVSIKNFKEKITWDRNIDFIFIEFNWDIYIYREFQEEINIKKKDNIKYFWNMMLNEKLWYSWFSISLDEIFKKKLTNFLNFT